MYSKGDDDMRDKRPFHFPPLSPPEELSFLFLTYDQGTLDTYSHTTDQIHDSEEEEGHHSLENKRCETKIQNYETVDTNTTRQQP
jgi:hypothetical protein